MSQKVFDALYCLCVGKKAEDAVFTRGKVKPRPVADMRNAWKALTKRAGLPGLLVHDLRRSAAKNMRLAGVPEAVAMSFTGHKTNNMYRRYAIISPADQKHAVALLEQAETEAENSQAVSQVPQIVPFPPAAAITVQ